MEEKEEGLSLGEIFHVLFIKKWLLLAVTLVITLFGVIFVQFLYNPGKVEYQATFQVKFPDAFKVENDSTRHYPDGTEFLYQELISLDNLKKAQAKDESFASINVEKMKRNNGISIQEYEATINNEPVKTEIYSIFILKKYFSSSEQAADFFEALIDIPVETILEKSKLIDYDRYLKQFDSLSDYASQMEILINQKELIIKNYDRLISTYSNAHTIILNDGSIKPISTAQSDIESYFTRYDLEAMKNEVELNGYVYPNSEFLINVRNNLADLERQLERNNLKLDNLQKQIKDISSDEGQTIIIQGLISEISKITEENAEIESTIKDYNKYLNASSEAGYAEKLASFESRMKAHYEKLQEFTDIYAAFNNEIYETNTKVLVSAGSIIVEDGGINILIALAASLVIGFVLGCCLNLCLELPKFLKEKKHTKELETEKEIEDTNE
ncbi:MAG: hypothetical protein K2I88_00860 [Anaeroplasmataceae bacterium]|nr:hypothetical protein [Anaeroplasmataceae bacterium]